MASAYQVLYKRYRNQGYSPERAREKARQEINAHKGQTRRFLAMKKRAGAASGLGSLFLNR